MDNALYRIAFHSHIHNIDLWMPINLDNGYHMSRYIAAGEQNIYSAAGITKELLTSYLDKMIEICNVENSLKTAKTDIAILANNLKYRTKFPVDQDCAIRMGAIYTFFDNENPNEINGTLIARKMDMCKGTATTPADPKMYDFFLHMGIGLTPTWKEYAGLLTNMDYFSQREEQLRQLTPMKP
jgi:hypothetical protein